MAKFRSSSKPLRTFKPQARTVPTGTHSFEIIRWSNDGRGIAMPQGKTVFVKGALLGEQVDARYTATHKKFDEAQCVSINKPAPERVVPRCEYFGRCGGCDLQHVSDQQQLSLKQQQLQNLFAQLQADSAIEWAAPIHSKPFAYRHRARLAVKANRTHCRIGFRQSDSHDIVSINHCEVLYPGLNKQLPAIQALIASLQARSSIQELAITEDSYQQQGMILYSKQPLRADDLDRLEQFAHKTGLIIEVWPIKSPDQQPLWHSARDKPLRYALVDQAIDLQYSLGDFTQVNPSINQALLNRAIEWLSLEKTDTVIDFFCGIGNFSLAIAAQVEHVIGYELMPSMVAKAEANAEINNIDNVEFKPSNLMSATLAVRQAFNKVLLDPPRAGAEHLCRQLASCSASDIVYISCNAQTLLRDARLLIEGGYQLKAIALADMFPQTVHSEVVSWFTKASQ